MTLVCPDCFDQGGLKRRIKAIRPQYDQRRCDFHPTKKGVPIDAVSKIVDEVIRNNYYESGVDKDAEPNGDSLVDLLYDITEAQEHEIVEALSASLIENDDYWPPDGEEAFYKDDCGYRRQSEYSHEQHSARWQQFCEGIVNRQRFFNEEARETLEQIFEGLHLLRDDGGSAAIYKLQTSTDHLFRARIANDPQLQKRIAEDIERELGPPPQRLRSPGRMNPSGICTFYGAFDIDTCVAELRPAVGEVVIAAEFILRRPILVLDTTKFASGPKAQDIFTKTYNMRRNLWAFMARFMNEIAQPCLPYDEHLDYIPTQVVAEYLVHLHKFKQDGKEQTIDAIMFRSAQNGHGKNIAIFGDAASVCKEGDVKDGDSYTRRSTNPGLEVVPKSLIAKKVEAVRHESEDFYATFMDEDFPF